MNRKEFGRKRSWTALSAIPAILVRDQGKRRKTSVSVRGIPPEIRKEHLPVTSLGHYRYINLLGEEIEDLVFN
jgi:hypothetical protein